MLWNYSYYVCWGIAWVTGIIIVVLILCTAIAYTSNAKLPADDPNKREYHPFAIVLAPITLPFFLSLAVLILVLRALLFALLLITFVISLLFWRPLEEPLWIEKVLIAIGKHLLKANTYLIKLALEQWRQEPRVL
jgi:hypothetical protein